jgi:hypothetical protein
VIGLRQKGGLALCPPSKSRKKARMDRKQEKTQEESRITAVSHGMVEIVLAGGAFAVKRFVPPALTPWFEERLQFIINNCNLFLCSGFFYDALII